MANNDRELKRNGSGYVDPTACEAMKNVLDEKARLQKVLTAIFAVCDAADFHIEERIVIRDNRTGIIYR